MADALNASIITNLLAAAGMQNANPEKLFAEYANEPFGEPVPKSVIENYNPSQEEALAIIRSPSARKRHCDYVVGYVEASYA